MTKHTLKSNKVQIMCVCEKLFAATTKYMKAGEMAGLLKCLP